IRPDGSLVTWGTWGTESPASGMPTTGRFVAVTGGSLHSVALDANGDVVVWGAPNALGADYQAVVGVGVPPGIKFTAIAARIRYTLALSADGDIYGWGVDMGIFNAFWTPDGLGHFVAPRQAGKRYTAIAAGLGSTQGNGLIFALREDGSVAM